MIGSLTNALNKRGFLVEVHDDHIYFGLGNHYDELPLLEEMFRESHINVKVEGRNIYLLDKLTQEDLNNVIWARVKNARNIGGDGWGGWKYFIKRKHSQRINTFILDPGIALLVKAFSSAGIATSLSCDGHGKEAPVIAICGKYNAAWFYLHFNKIKMDLNLHYDWKIKNEDKFDPLFTADKCSDRWDIKKVHEDNLVIAKFLLDNTEKLSNIKFQLFRNKYKSTRKLVREMNFSQLFDWMEERYNSLTENTESKVIV